MALSTLQACFQAGHYPSLSAKDRKIMCSPLLCAYQEIFDFMKRHGCKVEQESFMAIEL
jgi:cephalosporin-C deacetylase-like acetyl esterase